MTDPLFQRTADNQVYYYQNDHLGTPQRLIKSNGAIVWRATYTAFGEATVDPDSSIENNLRFPGQYYDAETQLHHNYFRDYDPTIGRYIQSDPIGLDGGINTYAYVENNPLLFVDLKGLSKSGARRPNSWDLFRSQMKGQGYSNVQLSHAYRQLQLAKLGGPNNPELHFWLDKLNDPSADAMRDELKTLRCNAYGVCKVDVEKCNCQQNDPQSCSPYDSGPQMKPLANKDPRCSCWTETIEFLWN